MSRTAAATGMALGVTLVLSAPALGGDAMPGLGQFLGNSNAQPGQQNCLGKLFSSVARNQGLRVGQLAGEGESAADFILPAIAEERADAAGEGEVCANANGVP